MWQLEGSKARLETSKLQCELDLASPERGLTGVAGVLESKRSFQAVGAAMMQLTMPSKSTQLADAYVRGNDLVATYEESIDHPCRPQVYWRVEDVSDFFGIQLIVSVQTSILHAIPRLTVTSQVAGPAQLLDNGIALVALRDSDVCYVEIADESNVESTVVHDETQITRQLFPGSLEKGVIQRARILGCFLPADTAVVAALSLREEFIQSSPPLTT